MDYNSYRFKKGEWVRCLLPGAMLLGCISFLFYRSVYAFLAGLPFLALYMRSRKKVCIKKRKETLTRQFQDAISAFSGALSVGYSVENAWREAYRDMQLLYDEEADIMKELSGMLRQLDNNAVLENLLLDFARRADVPDICDFAEVFSVAKRSGGDLSAMIQNTVDAISDKIEVKREIQVSLASRTYEQSVMNVIPLAMIAYISISSPHYFDPLYHNAAGVVIMTGCLLLYAAAYALSQRLLQDIFRKI
ncbi:MAG: type II secretion system F family protein [Lachnospiraceae bacterium]|nr:type II secretion system F family protein [Lachnospiraceae bacterium]